MKIEVSEVIDRDEDGATVTLELDGMARKYIFELGLARILEAGFEKLDSLNQE